MINVNTNINATKVVRFMSGLNQEELKFVQQTAYRSLHKKVPVKQAAEFTTLQVGQKISAKGPDGKFHNVEVKRVNQKYVKVHEPIKNVTWDVFPKDLAEPIKASSGSKEKVAKVRTPRRPRTGTVRKNAKVKSNTTGKTVQ